MKKIYLAISNRDKEIASSFFEKKYLDTKEALKPLIKFVKDEKHLTTILEQEDDYILIIEKDWIENINILSKSRGKVYYIHPNVKEPGSTKTNLPNVYIFSTLNDVYIWWEEHETNISPKKSLLIDKGEEQHDSVNETLEEDFIDEHIQKNKTETELKNKNEMEESIDNNERDHINRTLLAIEKGLSKLQLSKYHYAHNKTIGVWSPISQNGVTSLVMSLAMYFGYHHIKTAVVEGIKENQEISTILQRLTNKPENWSSLLQMTTNNAIRDTQSPWFYRGVAWFPLAKYDIKKINELNWSSQVMKHYTMHYMQTVKAYDVVLVDLETDAMRPYTKHILDELDELWIVVNGNYARVLAWKEYINQMLKSLNVDVSVIVVKKGDKVKEKEIAEQLGYPLLATIPNLSSDIENSYYSKKPLLDMLINNEPIKNTFNHLLNHVVPEKPSKKYSPLSVKTIDLFRSIGHNLGLKK